VFKRTELERFDDLSSAPGEFASSKPLRNGRPMTASEAGDAVPARLQRRKSLKQVIRFWLMNALIGSGFLVVCLAIVAEGISNLLQIGQMKLHKLPLPLVSMMERYEGFNTISLSHLISILLFVSVTLIWIRVIKEAKGFGNLLSARSQTPIIFWLYAAIAAVNIAADAFLFYLGVASRGGGWGEMPLYVPAVCTCLYVASVAGFAAFHADYVTSESV
jgi:hypothetical protein